MANSYKETFESISKNNISSELKGIVNSFSKVLETAKTEEQQKTLISKFVEVAKTSNLDEKEVKLVTDSFKTVILDSLGVKETLNTIFEDYEYANDPVFKERLNMLKSYVNENQEYNVIENVIDTLRALTQDEVLKESISILESNYESFKDDIKVQNMIDFLKSSPDYKSYKSSYDECISKLNEYNLDPTVAKRSELLKCLKGLSYKMEVKEFIQYLTSINYADDNYNTNVHLPNNNTMATSRTYTGGFLSKWNNEGKENAGLSSIVQESIEAAADMMSNGISERQALKLLNEKLNTSSYKFNVEEKEFLRDLRSYSNKFDLGLNESLDNIKSKNAAILYKNPNFVELNRLVTESFEAGIPDKNIVGHAITLLERMSYDPIISKELVKIKSIYESKKDDFIIEDSISYLEKNDKLNVFESFLNDLKEYRKEPTVLSKKSICEKYKNLTRFDKNVAIILETIERSIPSKISNSNPVHFDILDVYSPYSRVGNVDHFVIGNSYIIKEGNEIRVVEERKIDEGVSTYSKLLKKYNFKVLNEGEMNGFDSQKNKYSIVYKNNSKSDLFINESLFENTSEDLFKLIHHGSLNSNIISEIKYLNENSNTMTNMNFAHTIVSKVNPRLKAHILLLENDNYYINFINEDIYLDKWTKSNNYKTVRNKLYEFMGFDLSTTFRDKMNLDENKANVIRQKANQDLEDINMSEQKLSKLKSAIKLEYDKEARAELESIYEGFVEELDLLKKSYRKKLDILADLEN